MLLDVSLVFTNLALCLLFLCFILHFSRHWKTQSCLKSKLMRKSALCSKFQFIFTVRDNDSDFDLYPLSYSIFNFLLILTTTMVILSSGNNSKWSLVIMYCSMITSLFETLLSFYRYYVTKYAIKYLNEYSSSNFRILIYFAIYSVIYCLFYIFSIYTQYWLLILITILIHFLFNMYCNISFSRILIKQYLNIASATTFSEDINKEMLATIYKIRRYSVLSCLFSTIYISIITIFQHISYTSIFWTLSCLSFGNNFVRNRLFINELISRIQFNLQFFINKLLKPKQKAKAKAKPKPSSPDVKLPDKPVLVYDNSGDSDDGNSNDPSTSLSTIDPDIILFVDSHNPNSNNNNKAADKDHSRTKTKTKAMELLGINLNIDNILKEQREKIDNYNHLQMKKQQVQLQAAPIGAVVVPSMSITTMQQQSLSTIISVSQTNKHSKSKTQTDIETLNIDAKSTASSDNKVPDEGQFVINDNYKEDADVDVDTDIDTDVDDDKDDEKQIIEIEPISIRQAVSLKLNALPESKQHNISKSVNMCSSSKQKRSSKLKLKFISMTGVLLTPNQERTRTPTELSLNTNSRYTKRYSSSLRNLSLFSVFGANFNNHTPSKSMQDTNQKRISNKQKINQSIDLMQVMVQHGFYSRKHLNSVKELNGIQNI